MKEKDLTNQRFGKLIALYKCNYKKGNRYPWHCKCDCGNEIDVIPNSLLAGKTKSCGCLRKKNMLQIRQKVDYSKNIKDLTGQKFGKLTALKRLTEHHPIKWLCQCDCGNQTIVNSHDLVSKNTSSCGCLKSVGEQTISELLNKYKISFVAQKTFNDCLYPDTNGKAIFDFYVNNEYLIEYDGIQHFEENVFFKLSLDKQREKDQYKNKWCKEHNIPLIRIPYTRLNELKISDLILTTSDFIIK